MKILITGGSGFVGRNIREYLQCNNRGYEISAPSSRELDCLDESAVTEYLRQNSFDYVLHFATYGDSVDKKKDGTKILEYNMRIFLNFYKNSGLYGKMYYTGSGAEFDKRGDIVSVTEEQIGQSIPVDPYGLMKYTVGQMIEKSDNIYNFRLWGIFGKYEYYPSKFISNVCCKAVKGLPLSMRRNVYFDYLWIDDFGKILQYFLHHTPQYHTYNAVSGEKISLEQICRIVIEISQKDLPILTCSEGLANEYTASNRRLINEMEGFDYTPIEDSIRQLYCWYSQHEKEIDLYQLLY
jgi:GDP-L-fucose synthase